MFMDLDTVIIDSSISNAIQERSRIDPRDMPEMSPDLTQQYHQIDYGVPLYVEIPLCPEKEPGSEYDKKPASREWSVF